MPLFKRNSFGADPSRDASPAVSELEAMIRACHEIEAPMTEIALDAEEWGLISEDTYMYTGPKLIELMRSISMYARTCAQGLQIGEEDQMDFETDPHETQIALMRFVSEHRRVLESLVSQHRVFLTTGPLYASISRGLRIQKVALENFRSALENKYPLVRLSSRGRFDEMAGNLAIATDLFATGSI